MGQEMDKVEQLLAMLKIAGKGPGLKDAVSRALAEPSLFVYGELVQLSSIQELQGTDEEYLLRTLKLFAFGTFAQYRETPAQFMELNDTQLLKLRQLSICTLANAHVVGYDALLQALELPTVRALEDFIIQHCLYTGLLKCQLDQRHRRLHVQEVYHRDVEPAHLSQLTSGLQQLLTNVRQVMSTLDQNVAEIAAAHAWQRQAQADADAKFEQAKQSSTMMENLDAEGDSMVDDSFAHGLLRGTMACSSSRAGRARPGPDTKKSRKFEL